MTGAARNPRAIAAQARHVRRANAHQARLASYREAQRQAHAARSPIAYSIFWLVWVLAGIAVEITAAVTTVNQSGTLSDNWWAYVNGDAWPEWMPRSAGWAGRILILAFGAWIGPHLAWGWWS